MKAEIRRKEIATILMASDSAISGGELSKKLGVSRQIIVQDIALLKASGYDILSTHNGYIIQNAPSVERVFKVKHTSNETEDELKSIVELGGTVVDVYVWHKVYGKIEAPMNIFSIYQVEKFIEGIRSGKSVELMNITGGYHYHTIRADSAEILDNIEKTLESKNYIVPEI